jgi:hypothetical protein
MAFSSSLTLEAQCEHVIPATKISAETGAATGADASTDEGAAQHAHPAFASFKPSSMRSVMMCSFE